MHRLRAWSRAIVVIGLGAWTVESAGRTVRELRDARQEMTAAFRQVGVGARKAAQPSATKAEARHFLNSALVAFRWCEFLSAKGDMACRRERAAALDQLATIEPDRAAALREQAASLYQDVLRETPGDAYALLGLGLIRGSQASGKPVPEMMALYLEAAALLRKAEAAEPKLAEAPFSLGLVLDEIAGREPPEAAQSDYRQALAALDRALGLGHSQAAIVKARTSIALAKVLDRSDPEALRLLEAAVGALGQGAGARWAASSRTTGWRSLKRNGCGAEHERTMGRGRRSSGHWSRRGPWIRRRLPISLATLCWRRRRPRVGPHDPGRWTRPKSG